MHLIIYYSLFLIPFLPTIIYFTLYIFRKDKCPTLVAGIIGFLLTVFCFTILPCGIFSFDWVTDKIWGHRMCIDLAPLFPMIFGILFLFQTVIFIRGYFTKKEVPDVVPNTQHFSISGTLLSLPFYFVSSIISVRYLSLKNPYSIEAIVIGLVSLLIFIILLLIYRYMSRYQIPRNDVSLFMILKSFLITTIILVSIHLMIPG